MSIKMKPDVSIGVSSILCVAITKEKGGLSHQTGLLKWEKQIEDRERKGKRI